MTAGGSKPRVVAILQARMRATRLPRKVLMDVEGRPLIARVVDRVRAARKVDEVVVAVPEGPADEELRQALKGLSCSVFSGSEDDVLDRYYQAARAAKAGIIVRVTSDCPLADPLLIDRVVELLDDPKVGFASNNTPPSYPHGFDIEAFRFDALESAWKEGRQPQEREHVTPFIRGNPQRWPKANLSYGRDLYHAMRLTVDEPADLEVVRAVYRALGPKASTAGVDEIVALIEREPALTAANSDIRCNHYWDAASGQWRFRK